MTTTLRAARDLHIETLGDHEARLLFPEPRPNFADTRFATLFTREHPLELELGGTLAPIRVAFQTYGRLNRARDNAVFVCHALTGSASLAGSTGWWPDAVGSGRMLDPDRDYIICSNVLGGCYGTTGPTSPDPSCDRDYGPNFPEVTIGDIVRVQVALLDHLGVDRARAVVGGSMGGMQALEWLRSHPSRVNAGVIIGAPARRNAWAIAWGYLGRKAIEGDPEFRGGRYASQPRGLALARAIATVSYRAPFSLDWTQGRRPSPVDPDRFAIETYLDYQGEKLIDRFDANSYLALTRAMDRFEIPDADLARVEHRALCVGISSDTLYPASDVRALADALPRGEYWELHSPHGHDAFLLETPTLSRRVERFLQDV